VPRRRRQLIARWLIAGGALALFASLFVPWSHQFSPAFLARWGASNVLRGVPRDPTAWQVYSIVDVALALLSLGLMAVARAGNRAARMAAGIAAALALAFTLHALGHPPTNGANVVDPARSVPGYFPNAPGAGVGEIGAIAALGAAIAGLGLAATAD
jgi:CBS-domain-containing membrane protein